MGTQYRSVVFFHSPEQEEAARASLKALEDSGAAGGKVATEITKATDFWRAEEYHQRYVQKQGRRRGLP